MFILQLRSFAKYTAEGRTLGIFFLWLHFQIKSTNIKHGPVDVFFWDFKLMSTFAETRQRIAVVIDFENRVDFAKPIGRSSL